MNRILEFIHKMWRRFVQYLWRPDTLTGVAVQITAPGSVLLHACKISVFRDRLDILDKHTGLKNIGHFAKQYPVGPVALCLSGKGVITLQKMPPNANPDDFYIQYHQQEEVQYLSLMRRSEADQLIAELESYGFTVLSLSLGEFAATDIALPEAILDGDLRLAYGAAFQALVPDAEPVEVEAPVFTWKKEQAFAKVKLTRRALLFVLVMASLLIFNFILHLYYADKEHALAVKSRGTAVVAGQLKSTESEINRKVALIRSAGWTAGLNPAFILDRLIAGMPEQLTLQEFSLNPPKKDLKKLDAGLVYEKGLVEISGLCKEANALNNWLIAIKTYDWVQECKIKNYLVSAENGQGMFTVQVQLKDQEE